jgi:hypothetical protein
MKLNIEFQNYKLLKDTKACLDGSNVYLVQGANEQGKTSFINGLLTMLQAENKTKQPVTIGENKGKIALDLQTKGGKAFKMLFEFTDKKNKFTLISDNQLISKVTDIRSFLQYQSLTADEFISWGNTAEGRRKQRDIVLNLLPEEVKKDFEKLSHDEVVLYQERTVINTEIKNLESIKSQRNNVVTDEDNEQISKISEYKLERDKIKTKIDKAREDISKIDTVNREIDNILDACQKIGAISSFKDFDNLHTIAELAAKNKLDRPDIDWLYTKYNEMGELIQSLLFLEEKLEIYKKEDKNLLEKTKKADHYTDLIQKARTAKDQLIKNSNFPLEDIEITDDGLMLKSGTELLPFDINQVSTSRIMFIVAKIILLLNKHLPIIVMGRGEAFDPQKLADLSKFAEENDCLLIIDKVTNTAGIEIIGYENKGA